MTSKKNKSKMIKRNFITGDEWLYYKIYTGQKTAEKILSEIIKPVSQELLNKKIIDKWFFIRYTDPEFHLRVRFHLPGQGIEHIIKLLRNNFEPYLEDLYIHSIQTDIYKRELERYGSNTIEDAETLFYYDSVLVSEMSDMLEGDEGEEIRWKFAVKAVDKLFSDFGFKITDKLSILEILKDNFGKEFGLNKSLKKQLDYKFSENRAILENILKEEGKDFEYLKPLFKLINIKSLNTKKTIENILTIKEKNMLEVHFNNLMSSYSHMLINRIFLVQPRLNEFVIYYLLHKYYNSEIARNNSMIKQKQAKNIKISQKYLNSHPKKQQIT